MRQDRRTKATLLVALSYLSDRLELDGPLPDTPYNKYFRSTRPLSVGELKRLERRIDKGELTLSQNVNYGK